MTFARALRNHSILLIFLSALLIACNGKSKDQSDKTEDNEVETREPTDDELREIGEVIDIEDGAYPMFSITVEFAKLEMQRTFNFNVEASALDIDGLMALKDKLVGIYYTSELENWVLDAVYECESVFGDEHAELGDDFKEITGVLSGAESVSGDLPSEFMVTASDGTELSFKEFITEEMVQVNGEKITVYYYVRGVDTITYLREAED